MIGHTQDFDIAVLAVEYKRTIKKYFLGHKIIPLFSSLGFVIIFFINHCRMICSHLNFSIFALI